MLTSAGYIESLNSSHAVAEVDLEGVVLQTNELFEDLFGQSNEIAIGRHHPSCTHDLLMKNLVSGLSWQGSIAQNDQTNLETTLLIIPGKQGAAQKGLIIQKPIPDTSEMLPRGEGNDLLENLQLILKNAAVVTTLYTRQGKPVYVSPVASKIFGYTPKELMALPSYHGILDTYRPTYFKYIEEVLDGSCTRDGLEFRYRKKDGEIVWLFIRINPILDENGHITHLQSSTQNIDQQKQYELKLKQSEANALAILNSSDSMIILSDRNQRIIKCNDKVRILAPSLFGCSMEGLDSMKKLFPKAQYETHIKHFGKALKGEASTHYTELLVDSQKKWFKYQYHPIWLHDGSVSSVSWMATDVTDMKKAQDYAVSLLKRLNIANHAAGIGIWEYNHETGRVKFDDQCLQLFRGTIDVVTSIDQWARFYEKKSHRKIMKIFELEESREHDSIEEILSLSPNIGGIAFHQIKGQIEYQGKEPVGAIGIMMDISKTKKFEQSLENSSKKLNDAHRLAKMGGFEYELNSRTISWTDNCFSLHGMPLGEPISFQEYIKRVHPQDRESFTKALRQVTRQNKSLELSYRYVSNKSERIFNLILQASYFRNKPTKILGTIQDITDNVSLQKALEQKKALLDASSKRLSDYSFVNSHKVRAPLSNILGLVQIIRMETSDDLLDMLERSAEDLDQVIHELNSILGE